MVLLAGTKLRLARPWFWPLGWGGAFLGSVLASSEGPAGGGSAGGGPAGGWPMPAGEAWVPVGGGAVLAVRAGLLALLLGPLVWMAVLAQNDLYDLPTDLRNPRKATAPLVTGAVSPRTLRRWHRGSAAVTVLVAAALGPVFLAGAVLVLGLGWAYSAPPLRLKGRPGADVAVNALVVGVLAPAAGWALLRPVTAYPTVWIVLGFLLAAALYLPTTVLDAPADRAAGLVTSAVRWGSERCYLAGLAMWTGATALWLGHLGWDGLVQQVAAPAVVIGYAVLAHRPTIARMAGVVAIFAVPAGDFLVNITR